MYLHLRCSPSITNTNSIECDVSGGLAKLDHSCNALMRTLGELVLFCVLLGCRIYLLVKSKHFYSINQFSKQRLWKLSRCGHSNNIMMDLEVLP